jgi:hypothetical protein
VLRVYNFFGGRSMTAFWSLLLVGVVLAFMGKLSDSFVALAGTLYAFVVGRAISEDKFLQGKAPDGCAPSSAPAAG